MILNIFDFDDTLFRIPIHTGAPKDFDISGDIHKWYDHPESLNDEKYKVQCIETVANRVRASYESVYNHTILITRRVPTLTAEILRILNKHQIYFDKSYIIGHNTSKADVLAEIMSVDLRDDNVKEVNIYEDCLFQILSYAQFFEKLHYPNEIQVNYFFVDKTHLIKLHDPKATVLKKLVLKD